MTYLKDFQERIDKNDYPGFLKLWEEFCYSDEPDGKEFIQILEAVKSSELSQAFGRHIEKGLSLWKLLKDEKLSYQALKLIFDIQTTNSPSLADLAYQYLEKKYPNDPLFSEKLRLIGLRGGSHFEGAISKYELLTHMAPGKFVFHKSGWGTCEILDLSMVREEITLECDLVLGQKHLSFENAFKNLYPLADDHFLALRFGNPDKLESMAKKHPCEVIRILLRDLGEKTSLEMKEELFDLVIPSKEWNKWWQATRSKIKKDTKIASPKDPKGSFRLREKAVSHEELFQKALEKKPSVDETIQMVYSFLRDFPETLKNSEFKTSLQTRIEEVLTHETLNTEQTIQLYFFLNDLNSSTGKKEIKELFLKTVKLKDLIQNIQIISFKKRALVYIKKVREDWESLFLDLLPSIEPNTLKDYLLNELLKAKSVKIKEKIKEIIDHPISYPTTFVWYFQKIFSNKEELPFSSEKERTLLFENFFVLLSHINNRTNLKDLGKKMVQLVSANRFQIVRDVMKTSTLQEAKEYLLLSSKCEMLSDDIKIMHSLAAVVHPSLSQETQSEQEEVIWTTQEGYQKVQQRVSDIATVETIENAKEIEEAKSFGDLRENAEYKAALEKRDRLQSELKLLSSQLNKAKIITPKDVSTQEVNIGTIVDCKDTKGKIIQFTLLGPWDADPEKHILSFQSKLAKTMIGKKIGDTFTFQNEEFSIQNIHNYFDQK